MTRAEFLNDLYHHLRGMTKEQAEQHLTYYAEMLADRMEEGMSEAEAVESMEDVETIARRILEEEGLPPSPSAAPPAYPDVSRTEGDDGKRTYQVPKKLNRRRVIQAALWALAIVAILGALSRQFWRMGNRASDVPVDLATESAPQAPYAEEYYYPDAPFAEGYDYSGEEYSFDYEEINSVDVQWASGMVHVQRWSGDCIQVQEFADFELSERTRMSCAVTGQTLEIRYRNGGGILNRMKGSKWLTVLVPDGMLEKLDMETASADVQIFDLELTGLDVSTASGIINATECYAQTANLTTISGNMELSMLYAEALVLETTSGELNGTAVSAGEIAASSVSGDIYLYSEGDMENARLSSVSGDIYLSLEDSVAQSIGANSTSGDITLCVPYDLGFTMDYSTVSGDLSSGLSEMLRQNGKYICNGGGCEIQVNTVSGDLDIY